MPNLGKPKKLAEMKPGQSGRICEIDPSIKERVAGMGIRVGEKIQLCARQPLKGPLAVIVRGRTASIGREIARLIQVEVEG